MIAFFVFGYLDRINQYISVRAEVSSLEEDLSQAKQRNAELKATLDEVAGSAYVAETARSELGLIQPGDDPFVILGSGPELAGEPEAATEKAAALASEESADGEADTGIFHLEWWRAFFRQ